MTGPYDGQRVTYEFGWKHYPQNKADGDVVHPTTTGVSVTASSLRMAVRKFRAGTLFPEKCASKVDGKVHVYVLVQNGADRTWTCVATIEPREGADAAPLPLNALLGGDTASVSETAMARAGALTGLQAESVTEMEARHRDIARLMADLEKKKQELQALAAALQNELKHRVEQVWILELFLGSHETVVQLRDGEPAPVDTPIAVRQAVLCMDEEIALFDALENPDNVGAFDNNQIKRFDQWILGKKRLDGICPWPKGIVGLRVRRTEKTREDSGDLGMAMANAEEAKWDRMTYLLIRNGERLYRVWIDVQLWPRLFSSEQDVQAIENPDEGRWESYESRDARERVKQQVAGLIALQGILERSKLLHPLPRPDLNVFNVTHADHFLIVRDGEGQRQIGDNAYSRLTWGPVRRTLPDGGHETVHDGYQGWLRSQLAVGVRVLFLGSKGYEGADKMANRVGIKSVTCPPARDTVYTLDKLYERHWYSYTFSFMYLPKDDVYTRGSDGWVEERDRKRRVRYRCYNEEVVPIDFLSWRVLHHLLLDRSQREHYQDFFWIAVRYYKLAKAEALRERPFIDLVLRQTGADLEDEAERARCERLLRWWKIKTQEHRTLGTDEAKALRMIKAAFLRGEDHDNDPEVRLFKELA